MSAIALTPGPLRSQGATKTGSGVVPAKAGTHNHRLLWLRKVTTACISAETPRRMGPCIRRGDQESLINCVHVSRLYSREPTSRHPLYWGDEFLAEAIRAAP